MTKLGPASNKIVVAAPKIALIHKYMLILCPKKHNFVLSIVLNLNQK